MIRVAINGFGRIGRMVFRAGLKDKKIQFVGINDLTDTDNLAYLLKYDSVHGKFDGKVNGKKGCLQVNGKTIPVYAKKDPAELPWKELKVDIVVESTGFFTHKEDAMKHITAGAKKVLLSAPGKGKDLIKTIVMGVNDNKIKKKDVLLSNASCTTNGITPIVKVLNDNFGIVNGMLMTIHSYTGNQRLVDSDHKKDVRRGRSAAINIIPTNTGAGKSIGSVIPELEGKISAKAIRVPTPDGSIVEFCAQLKKKVKLEKLKSVLKKACSGRLKGIVEYTEEELVSSDIINNPHSGIIDANLIQVQGNLVKVFSWYDNEWGYSVRMIDMIKKMV